MFNYFIFMIDSLYSKNFLIFLLQFLSSKHLLKYYEDKFHLHNQCTIKKYCCNLKAINLDTNKLFIIFEMVITITILIYNSFVYKNDIIILQDHTY